MCNVSRKTGFALAEILVALMITTMAVVLVAGLTQQIMNFKKSSSQIAGVIELRGKTAALIKDPDRFLGSMRTVETILPNGSVSTFSACLPMASDPASSIYTCPDIVMDANQLQAAGLVAPALNVDATEGGRYSAMETRILDSSGVQIAGTGGSLQYLSDDGVPCTLANPATACPFISTGYFLRENIPTAANPTPFPGQVKFVATVRSNPGYQRSGLSPMKPQVMSMDLGTGWTQASSTGGPTACTPPQVFQGIQPDGTPKCADPAAPCATGTIQVGYGATGPLCEDPSTLSCPSGQQPILDPVAKKLICSSLNHCAIGKIFTGYHSGSGAPICEDPDQKCPNGKLQMGYNSNGPICAPVPNCVNPNPLLTYNGTAFSCTAATNTNNFSAASCSNGVMRGIASDGTPICTTPPPPSPRGCGDNEYLQGFDTNDVAICKPIPKTCPANEILIKAADGITEQCISMADYLDSKSCADGFLSGWMDGEPICAKPSTGSSLPPTMSLSFPPTGNAFPGKCNNTAQKASQESQCDAKCAAAGYTEASRTACTTWGQTITCGCSVPLTTGRPDKNISLTKLGACEEQDLSAVCKAACKISTYSYGKNPTCTTRTTLSISRSNIGCTCSDTP